MTEVISYYIRIGYRDKNRNISISVRILTDEMFHTPSIAAEMFSVHAMTQMKYSEVRGLASYRLCLSDSHPGTFFNVKFFSLEVQFPNRSLFTSAAFFIEKHERTIPTVMAKVTCKTRSRRSSWSPDRGDFEL
jgi:hypothetical protein